MNKISYIGIKEEGRAFRIVNRALLDQELTALPKGKYSLVVEKYRNKKSNPQLGYYFACLLPLSWKLLLDAGWDIASLDEVDVFWKSKFANQDIVNKDTAEVVSIPALKRNFTTTDMMAFCDAIRNYCSEYLGGYIPEPGEQITMEL